MSTTTANPKKVKRRARNSREPIADKYCDSCHQNITENEQRDMLRVTSGFDKRSAKNYCKEHELSYSDQKCKPIWCGDCKYLIKYEITINWKKKSQDW
jgi:hypothetical protein